MSWLFICVSTLNPKQGRSESGRLEYTLESFNVLSNITNERNYQFRQPFLKVFRRFIKTIITSMAISPYQGIKAKNLRKISLEIEY